MNSIDAALMALDQADVVKAQTIAKLVKNPQTGEAAMHAAEARVVRAYQRCRELGADIPVRLGIDG